jgi:hypothetical protein
MLFLVEVLEPPSSESNCDLLRDSTTWILKDSEDQTKEHRSTRSQRWKRARVPNGKWARSGCTMTWHGEQRRQDSGTLCISKLVCIPQKSTQKWNSWEPVFEDGEFD